MNTKNFRFSVSLNHPEVNGAKKVKKEKKENQAQNRTTTLTQMKTGNGRNQLVLPVVRNFHHLPAKKVQKPEMHQQKLRKIRGNPAAKIVMSVNQPNLVRNLVLAIKNLNKIQKKIVFVNQNQKVQTC